MGADRRVREGVAKARSGDQKAAIERYDAALELCPKHKEAAVARGAALVNRGRLADALRDFDLALSLDPQDANATKYRSIARDRMREESINARAESMINSAVNAPAGLATSHGSAKRQRRDGSGAVV